jgi:hypothetical protein
MNEDDQATTVPTIVAVPPNPCASDRLTKEMRLDNLPSVHCSNEGRNGDAGRYDVVGQFKEAAVLSSGWQPPSKPALAAI